MSIWRAKGKWYVRVMNKGQYYTPGEGYATKKEAQEEETFLKQRLKKTITPQRSFYSLMQEYLDECQAINSKAWYDAKRFIFYRYFKTWFGRTIESLSPTEIQDHLIERSHLSARSANLDFEILRHFFRWAKTRKYLQTDVLPTNGLRKFPMVRAKVILPSTDVMQVLLANNQGADRLLVALLVFTLGRISEIKRLEWDDIDLPKHILYLRTRKTATGSEEPRSIPIHTLLWDILNSEKDRTGFVLKSRADHGYHDLRKRLRRCFINAGLPIFKRPFHTFRHFGASMLADLGVPPKVVQELLGHTSLATTNVYVQAMPWHKVEAISRLMGVQHEQRGSERPTD